MLAHGQLLQINQNTRTRRRGSKLAAEDLSCLVVQSFYLLKEPTSPLGPRRPTDSAHEQAQSKHKVFSRARTEEAHRSEYPAEARLLLVYLYIQPNRALRELAPNLGALPLGRLGGASRSWQRS